MKLPDFLIAGVMKCGTSSLLSTMATHPQIYVADREVHFFDRHWDKGLDWYRQNFPDDGRVAGEKTPAYFKKRNLWPSIKKTLPDAKIILSLRDPVSRMLSQWNMFNRKTGQNCPLHGLPKNKENEMIRMGEYYDDITRFLDFYDRERVLVVIAEETWREPEMVYADIQQFLGVTHLHLEPVPQTPSVYPKLDTAEETYIRFLVERYREPNQRLFEWLGREVGCWM